MTATWGNYACARTVSNGDPAKLLARSEKTTSGPVLPRRGRRLGGILTGLLSPGKKRGPLARADLLERAEADGSQARAQSLGRHVDGGLGSSRRGQHHVTVTGREAGELLEEGDHVQEDDEVEGAGLEGQAVCIRDLEANPAGELLRQQSVRFVDHRRREVHADNARLREAAGNGAGPLPGAGTHVEDVSGRRGKAIESGAEGEQGLGPDTLLPAGGEAVELAAQGAAEDTPELRPRDDGARREPREAPAGLVEALAQPAGDSLTSSPTSVENMCAASPWLIASAMFLYASS